MKYDTGEMGNYNPRCIICGVALEPLYANEPEVDFDTSDKLCFLDGVVGMIMGGYGSRYDMTDFIIGVCDPCLDTRVKQGKIIKKKGTRVKVKKRARRKA